MTDLSQIRDPRRIARFATVGIGAAALLFVLSYLFVRIGMTPFSGSTIAYVIAFAVAYTAQRNWTFASKQGHGRTLPRYFVLQAGCAITSGLTAHFAVTMFDASPVAMSLATTAVASAVSFVLSSMWVFAADT